MRSFKKKRSEGRNIGNKRKAVGILLLAGMLSGCQSAKIPKIQKVEEITVWNYYNGVQKRLFDDLVQEFNETEGAKQGILVESVSEGNLNSLIHEISASAEGKIGSEKLPDLCSAYPETAFALNEKGLLADLSAYLSKEEQDAYVEAYLKEGEFEDDGSLWIFPIAKSTEVLTLNQTAWDEFTSETGADISELSTWEGVARISEQYYRWTDEKTPEPEDGKAFFGRDALANYLLVGSSQLGHNMISRGQDFLIFDFDEDAMKRLWNCYYLPYIRGYYTEEGRFRSDDFKVGNLIAYVGSTSGAAYTPEKIVYEDGRSEAISCTVFPVPNFEGTQPMVVQQGGGMVVLKGEESTERAAVEFLKWFTKIEENMKFCLGSGYLPVKREANSIEMLEQGIKNSDVELSKIMKENLRMGMKEVQNYRLYTTEPFAKGNEMRTVLAEGMTRYAKADREKVVEFLESGLTLEESVKKIHTEGRFFEWYYETYDKLRGLSIKE